MSRLEEDLARHLHEAWTRWNLTVRGIGEPRWRHLDHVHKKPFRDCAKKQLERNER